MFDIDVDSPAKLAIVLSVAAHKFREDRMELQAAWQDKKAGKIWDEIADKLENIVELIAKNGYVDGKRGL